MMTTLYVMSAAAIITAIVLAVLLANARKRNEQLTADLTQLKSESAKLTALQHDYDRVNAAISDRIHELNETQQTLKATTFQKEVAEREAANLRELLAKAKEELESVREQLQVAISGKQVDISGAFESAMSMQAAIADCDSKYQELEKEFKTVLRTLEFDEKEIKPDRISVMGYDENGRLVGSIDVSLPSMDWRTCFIKMRDCVRNHADNPKVASVVIATSGSMTDLFLKTPNWKEEFFTTVVKGSYLAKYVDNLVIVSFGSIKPHLEEKAKTLREEIDAICATRAKLASALAKSVGTTITGKVAKAS